MRSKEIKKLIELVEGSAINELEVSRFGRKVRIMKQPGNTMAAYSPEMMAVPSGPAALVTEKTILAAETPQKSDESEGIKKSVDSNIFEIKSPMVGTLYRAPAPEADPYVQEGDIVTANQVLCIIEAMKLMNEIESEVRGRVVEILVENGKPVEYDQVLFKLEKL